MKLGRKSAAIAIAATGALLAAGGAPAIGIPHARAAAGSTPQITVKMSGKHSLNVNLSKHLTAGRVAVKLVAGKGEQAFEIFRLRGTYTIDDFSDDAVEFESAADQPTPASLKAFRRLVRHTVFCGGLDSGGGHKTVTGTLVLPTAATYYVVNDHNGPDLAAPVTKLNVTASSATRAAPSVDVVQKTTNKKRFSGSVNLPNSGTLKLENAATNSPHQLFLLHVKTGTTRKQAIRGLRSNGPGPFLAGAVGTDVVNPGRSLTLDYTLPAGDYAELCFFPDLKTGMPHAFMGMVRIVHLS